MKTILTYVTTVFIFIAMDAVWLSHTSNILYFPTLGDILLPEPKLIPALVFYLIYPIGLVAFALRPAFESQIASEALINGALYGALAYATYDLTNYATLRNWTLSITLIDVTWGTCLSALTSILVFWLLKGMFKMYVVAADNG
jgi:uncharacterized membrane protein